MVPHFGHCCEHQTMHFRANYHIVTKCLGKNRREISNTDLWTLTNNKNFGSQVCLPPNLSCAVSMKRTSHTKNFSTNLLKKIGEINESVLLDALNPGGVLGVLSLLWPVVLLNMS